MRLFLPTVDVDFKREQMGNNGTKETVVAYTYDQNPKVGTAFSASAGDSTKTKRCRLHSLFSVP